MVACYVGEEVSRRSSQKQAPRLEWCWIFWWTILVLQIVFYSTCIFFKWVVQPAPSDCVIYHEMPRFHGLHLHPVFRRLCLSTEDLSRGTTKTGDGSDFFVLEKASDVYLVNFWLQNHENHEMQHTHTHIYHQIYSDYSDISIFSRSVRSELPPQRLKVLVWESMSHATILVDIEKMKLSSLGFPLFIHFFLWLKSTVHWLPTRQPNEWIFVCSEFGFQVKTFQTNISPWVFLGKLTLLRALKKGKWYIN